MVYEDTERSVFYNPANATSDFAGVAAPPTYAALSATPLAKSGNWQPIFDQWKATGKVA